MHFIICVEFLSGNWLYSIYIFILCSSVVLNLPVNVFAAERATREWTAQRNAARHERFSREMLVLQPALATQQPEGQPQVQHQTGGTEGLQGGGLEPRRSAGGGAAAPLEDGAPPPGAAISGPHGAGEGCEERSAARARVLARWLVDTFGAVPLSRGTGVLDVAGERGQRRTEAECVVMHRI